MATTILDANDLALLVQPDKIEAQGFLRPERVSVIAGTDHTGDDAYYVQLVYRDNTPSKALAWSKVKSMVRWVRNEIRTAINEERWAYVRVTRSSDVIQNPF